MRTTCLSVLFFCLSAACSAEEIPNATTPVGPPEGRYGPKDLRMAGEIITITRDSFRQEYFSDIRPLPPGCTGKIKVFKDHFTLDHPKAENPERVADVLNGVPVLWTKDAYQLWKRKGYVDESGILYSYRHK